MTQKTDAERAAYYVKHEIAEYIGDLLVVADGEFDEPESQREQARSTIKVIERWRDQIEKIEKGASSPYDD